MKHVLSVGERGGLSDKNFINVLTNITIVIKMITLYKLQYWNILKLFYKNNNQPLHLRQISRLINLKESALSRHLNFLLEEHILISETIGNMKFFKVKDVTQLFYLFDMDRFNNLPLLRKNAVRFYIEKLSSKPIFIIIFGSTAKGVFNDASDLDIIVVFNEIVETKQATKYSESQTGIRISDIRISFNDFMKEIKLKEDMVIQSAIQTGFIAYNHAYYYEVLGNEEYNYKKNVNRRGLSSE